jgi:hypothetical protein
MVLTIELVFSYLNNYNWCRRRDFEVLSFPRVSFFEERKAL